MYEIYLDIANEEKIEETYHIVCKWMDYLIVPKLEES